MATKFWKGLLALGVAGAINMACEDQGVSAGEDDPLLSVAELSSQLASGTEISFTTQSGSTQFGGRPAGVGAPPNGGQRPAGVGGGPPSGGGGRPGVGARGKAQDALLTALSMAERTGQHQGARMLTRMGATITHYDANGNEVKLAMPTAEEQKAPGKFHEAMAGVAKSVIEFSGTTPWGGSTSGKVTIDRVVGENSIQETITYQDLVINGVSIAGVRNVSRTLNQETGEMQFTSSVSGGLITNADGSVLTWQSEKQRSGQFVFDAEGNLSSGYFLTEGATTLTSSDGTILYSNKITEPIKVDLTCSGRRKPKPVSGSIESEYKGNKIEVAFGNGSCDSRSVTVTINGVTTARNVNG